VQVIPVEIMVTPQDDEVAVSRNGTKTLATEGIRAVHSDSKFQ
jgi:hypothetical protein